MNIKTRFLISFISFIIVPTLITAGIALTLFVEIFQLFAQANTPSLIPLMSHRIMEKSVVTLLIFVFIVLIVALPVGIALFNKFTKPYVNVFINFFNVAQERFSLSHELSGDKTELQMLEKLSTVLVDDIDKMKTYEKAASWKEGARMLIHEIKNPMTPIKLSVQSIALDTTLSDSNEEVKQILTSVGDMEGILNKFKEFVNIDFGPLKKVPLNNTLDDIQTELVRIWPDITIDYSAIQGDVYIETELLLLKMLFVNLVNNGMEANAAEFYYTVRQEPDAVIITFVTPNTIISEPYKIFNIGYSSKGVERGFGLFLCKKISEYLDLNLTVTQKSGDVAFSIQLTPLTE
ncbi:MAG: hypothetical protein OCD01_04540 [Fibrobacterales bacterium]